MINEYGLLKFYEYTGVDRGKWFERELKFSIGVGSIKRFETIDKESKEFTYTK